LGPGLGNIIKIEKVWSEGKRQEKDDFIPQESLLHLYINRQKICMISCSPENLIELAAGYAVSHGYVDDYGSINIIEICSPGSVDPGRDIRGDEIENIPVNIRTGKETRVNTLPGYISSGCGSLDEKGAARIPEPLGSNISIDPGVILSLNRKNLKVQEHKKALGGLHSAALFNIRGEMLLVREDIGRHNCLDKIIGHMLINGIETSDKILFTSGRISLDLVLKAARIKIPAVVTNSSATYSAVRLAGKLDLILIGYARGKRFNIYSHPERII
jgi:FdhD protein